MNDLPPTSATDPTPATVAQQLRLIADAIASLNPDVRFFRPEITLQITSRGAVGKGVVDQLGLALLGRPGEATEMPSRSWHYILEGEFDGVGLHAYSLMDPPADSVAALQARVAELEAQVAVGGAA